MKIVHNTCYGGFSLNDEGLKRYHEKTGKQRGDSEFLDRHDPALVEMIEEDAKKYSGRCSELRIYNLDDIFDGCYYIDDYDGMESVEVDYGKWLTKNITLPPDQFHARVKEMLAILKRPSSGE